MELLNLQKIIATVIVLAAVVYLARNLLHKRESTSGCGKCGCSKEKK